MPVTLDIPVPRAVKLYYEHESNFGANMTINQRSAVGGIITAALSFYPVEPDLLPVVWRDSKDTLEIMTVTVEMKLDVEMMLPHHFRVLGELLEKMYERELLAFCLGYFGRMPNYEGAITAWSDRYGLNDDVWDRDFWRKHIHRKYSKQINEILARENAVRSQKFKESLAMRVKV
ncbi:MAG TPA: hypothetical protein VK175_06190 [Leadbetterella sp.]|nr:hypothetical protein [Leadbetterella sp.]